MNIYLSKMYWIEYFLNLDDALTAVYVRNNFGMESFFDICVIYDMLYALHVFEKPCKNNGFKYLTVAMCATRMVVTLQVILCAPFW